MLIDWPYPVRVLVAALVVALGCVARAVLHDVRRRLARLSHREPKCGACRYIVHPGSGVICPECGQDLRSVGVLTPTTWPPLYPLGRQLLLAAGIGFISYPSALLLAPVIPICWRYSAWSRIVTAPPDRAPSDYTRDNPVSQGEFTVFAWGTGRWVFQRPDDVLAAWGSWRPYISGETHLGSLTESAAHLYGNSNLAQEWVRPDESGVRRFVEYSGFDPTSPRSHEYVKWVNATVENFRAGKLPPARPDRNSDNVSEGTFYELREGAHAFVMMALAVPAWFLFVRRLNRWHRRRINDMKARSDSVLREK